MYYVVYAVECSQDCTDLHTGEPKQPPHKQMAHRRDKTLLSSYIWGRKNNNNNLNILAREDRWFERGVKESIYVKLNSCIWKEEVAYDITLNITNYPPTMQFWVPSPVSLTTIHTWAHLALATHMKAS